MRIRFTANPKLPRDWADKPYRQGLEFEMSDNEAQRWINRGVAEEVGGDTKRTNTAYHRAQVEPMPRDEMKANPDATTQTDANISGATQHPLTGARSETVRDAGAQPEAQPESLSGTDRASDNSHHPRMPLVNPLARSGTDSVAGAAANVSMKRQEQQEKLEPARGDQQKEEAARKEQEAQQANKEEAAKKEQERKDAEAKAAAQKGNKP